MLVYPLIAEVPTIKEVFEILLPWVICFALTAGSPIMGVSLTLALFRMNFKFINE